MSDQPTKQRIFMRWLSMSRGVMSMATLLIGGILGGTWTLATVATTQADRVNQNSASLKVHDERIKTVEDRERILEITLGRIEGKIDAMREKR